MAPKKNTALRRLKALGVPDAAATAFLALLFGLTVLPYVAARDFGPYSIPALLTPGTHWLLSLIAPPLWLYLLWPSWNDWQTRKRWPYVVLAGAILVWAFLTRPIRRVQLVEKVLQPNSAWDRAITFELESSQKVSVALTAVDPPMGIRINFCGIGASGSSSCVDDQYGTGAEIVRVLQSGRVSVDALSYVQDAAKGPAKVTLEARYIDRAH